MTGANDPVTLTGVIPGTITNPGWGTFNASVTALPANASLDVVRTSNSLDYAWSATPGVGIGSQVDVYETFSLSGLSSYALTFDGSGYLKLHLQNTDTLLYLAQFGTGKGDVPIPALPFTLSGDLPAGNYLLTARMGQVYSFSTNTGTISLDVAAVPDGGVTSLGVILGPTRAVDLGVYGLFSCQGARVFFSPAVPLAADA